MIPEMQAIAGMGKAFGGAKSGMARNTSAFGDANINIGGLQVGGKSNQNLVIYMLGAIGIYFVYKTFKSYFKRGKK